MAERFPVTTDMQGGRILRDLVRNPRPESTIGSRPAPPAGARNAVVIETIEAIEPNNHEPVDVKLLELDGGTWVDSLQRVPVRNIGRNAIPPAFRTIARPVSNLGLCIEQSVTTTEGTYPDPQSYCCGVCVDTPAYVTSGGRQVAVSYTFLAPSVSCCLDCATLTTDTAAALSGSEILLSWDSASDTFRSDTAPCGDDATVRWVFDPDAETLALVESTGTTLVSFVAVTSPLTLLCPMKFKLSTYHTDCFVCGDELCLKPTAADVSFGCFGCAAGTEFPPFFTLSWDGDLDHGDPLTAYEAWTTDNALNPTILHNDNELWIVRPDLSDAMADVLGIVRNWQPSCTSSDCIWGSGKPQLRHWQQHSHQATGGTGACTTPFEAHLEQLGDVAVPWAGDCTMQIPVIAAGTITATRPGGANCGNPHHGTCAVSNWTCSAKPFGYAWRLTNNGGGGNVKLELRVYSMFNWLTNVLTDAGDVPTNSSGGSAGWGDSDPISGSLVPAGHTIDVDWRYFATWKASGVMCNITGAIELTLSAVESTTNWGSLPTTIWLTPSNTTEPPRRARRPRNCSGGVGPGMGGGPGGI